MPFEQTRPKVGNQYEDDRVLRSLSRARAAGEMLREIQSSLIELGNGVVEYVLFDNEGHGFTKKANEIRAYKAILDFLDRYLKNGGEATSSN